MSGYYQPAPETWRETPESVMLWAVTSVLHRVTRAMPESKEISAWQTKLDKALTKPVDGYAWGKLFTTKRIRRAKADDGESIDVPQEILDDWEATIGELIAGVTGLWQAAGEIRTTAEDLPFNPADLEAAMQDAVQMVKSIPETMHEQLRQLMRDAYADGTSQTGFAKKIRQEFKATSKKKAEQIAVTEWNRAASTATLLGYQAQGIASKMWFTAGDRKVCPTCLMNAEAGEVAIGEPFPSGVMAPPAHPMCRCNISAA